MSLIVYVFIFFANILNAAQNPDEFAATLAGAQYCRADNHFYIFNDALYELQNRKYLPLAALASARKEYAQPIDYERTYIIGMSAVATIQGGLFTQAATGGIYDCVGVVVQQVNSTGAVLKTLAVHAHGYKDLDSLKAIIDEFFSSASSDAAPDEFRVHFVTNYHTWHLLDLYHYFRSKSVSDTSMKFTRNTDELKPIYEFFNEASIVTIYFPSSYYESAKMPDVASGEFPIQDNFYDKYLDAMALLVDAKGEVYTKIRGYLEDCQFDDKGRFPEQLIGSYPHINLGLSICVNPNRYTGADGRCYFKLPYTPEQCLAELERLGQNGTLKPLDS